MPSHRTSRIHQYLDPATSLSELLFGLIMTLTFTLGAGIVIEDEGREGVRQLLIAVIGCNIAWGIIDGALYIMGQLFQRGRIRRMAQSVRDARDDATAVGLIAEELDGSLGVLVGPEDRQSTYARIATQMRGQPLPEARVKRDDVIGALASGLLVVITSVPAVIPFLLMNDLHGALRTSNAILLGLLFLTGYWWARFTLGKPWLVGLCFLVCGTILVAVAIPLGG